MRTAWSPWFRRLKGPAAFPSDPSDLNPTWGSRETSQESNCSQLIFFSEQPESPFGLAHWEQT